MDGRTELVSKLIAKQKASGAGDGAFARKLGVTRAVWFNVRTGRQPIGEKMLRGIVRCFPDLNSEVIIYLASPKLQPATAAV